jgi:hypothetical protein
MPLWGLDIKLFGSDAVLVRSWGEEIFLEEFAVMVNLPTMPAFFALLMWAYLGISVVLLLSSLLVGEKAFSLGRLRLPLPQLMIGGVGFVHLVFAAVTAIMITMKLGQFDAGVPVPPIPLQGTVYLNLGDIYASPATSSLRLGYWLAWATGALLIVLALLRNKIIGRNARVT